METLLNETEVRVLGSLVEKQVTTPDYYPLTMNALVHACNQISNRDPVVQYDERQVEDAVDIAAREESRLHLLRRGEPRAEVQAHDARGLHAVAAGAGRVCVLMLRGPQTVGEVRGRTGRLHEFADLREVEETLEGLARRDEPLVVKAPATGRAQGGALRAPALGPARRRG